MEFSEIVHKRYAVKKFDGRIVPQEKIDKLRELIRFAPSSFNIQPWFIVMVSDPEQKQRLQEAGMNQAQIGTCSHLFVFCANTHIAAKIHALEQLMIAQGASKESIKDYIGMMHSFEAAMTPEQRLSWAQRQLYLALGNAVNGAASLGFDSCPMEGFDPAAFSRILQLPSHIVPTALCAVGYAADSPRAKLRFAGNDVFG